MPNPDLDNHLSAFDEESDKAVLDRGAPSSKLPDGARKVELDLDDAPFLDNDYVQQPEQSTPGEARRPRRPPWSETAGGRPQSAPPPHPWRCNGRCPCRNHSRGPAPAPRA
jgi:hypothetical protein